MEARISRERGARVLAHETRTLVRLPNGTVMVIVRLYNGKGELVDWGAEALPRSVNGCAVGR